MTSDTRNWTASRVLATVFAGIGGLIGLALLVGGIGVLAAFAFGRDGDGYFTTERKALEVAGYAITAGDIDFGADEADWAPDAFLGDVRVRVDSETPVFVGIGPKDDVERYLGDVARGELSDFDSGEPEFEHHAGREPRTAPGDQGFWVAEAEGPGEQAVTWDAEFGRWSVVVMNADASRGVHVSADVGTKLGWAIWPGLGATALGLLMTIGAVLVIAGRPRRPASR